MAVSEVRLSTRAPLFNGGPPRQANSPGARDWLSGPATDGVIILLAAVIAYSVRLTTSAPNESAVSAWLVPIATIAWLAALNLADVYSLRQAQTGTLEFQRVLLASIVLAGAAGTLNYITNYQFPRGVFLLTFTIGTFFLIAVRYARRVILKCLHNRGVYRKPVLIAGSPTHIDGVARVLQREKWLGYEMIGAVTDADIAETPAGLPVLGPLTDIVELVETRDAKAVFFAEGSFPDSQHFKRMAWELEGHSAQMIVAPALADISASRLATRPVGGLPLVYVERPQALKAARWSKRLFDILGSSLLLLLSSPLIAIVAILIKLEDRGPVFFAQTRVGSGGKEFKCLKIRSMVTDAEDRKTDLEGQNEGSGVLFKIARDPRITKVGAVIRRFSIDELPQLWNILRGDMSLVGPRPALPVEVARYDGDALRRLEVRPGLTGLWQVSGRSDLPWDETVRIDSYYVDNWSFLQDLAIILRTVSAVVSSKGAY